MNTTTQTENLALAEIQRPANLPAGTTAASALMLSGDSMDKMMRIAEFMASAKATIPVHLRNPGDCLAVVMQATQWNMNPFAVAQKTHLVNGVLGYEAQLVAAVVNNSGLVVDRFNFEWFGAWEKIVGKFKEVESRSKTGDDGKPKKYVVPAWEQRDENGLGVKVWATIKGEAEPRVLELLMTQARTRNSTLWTEDPKQQLAYLAQKRWARLYAPDVLLGVYTPEELVEREPRDMGPAEVVSPWAPALLAKSREAAARGAKAYGDFWKELPPETQANLVKTSEHAENKAAALVADRNRTLDNGDAPRTAAQSDAAAKPAATEGPKVTFASVMERLVAAKTMDALDDAADWIGEVPDEQQRNELSAKYKALAAAMEGGA